MAQQVKGFVMADKLSPLPSIYGGQRQPITCTHKATAHTHTHTCLHIHKNITYTYTHKNTTQAHTCAHM